MGNTLTIFDLDNTLIQGDSSTVWSQFMVREGLRRRRGILPARPLMRIMTGER